MKPEMPKSFLHVVFALVVLAIPVFFIVLFLGSARRKKRLRATVMAQLDNLVNQLRQRNEVLLETLCSSPGSGAGDSLRLKAESQQELIKRFEASPRNLSQLSDSDLALESELQPWLQSMPDSYGKRKLVPLQERVVEARSRYNDAARICGQGSFPLMSSN
ncbi:MAG: hypothetical protein JWM16_606 [Verrucomicrobiales bacterium]|nr:hypothetical protein [Verrucomicrobiales bacterium]